MRNLVALLFVASEEHVPYEISMCLSHWSQGRSWRGERSTTLPGGGPTLTAADHGPKAEDHQHRANIPVEYLPSGFPKSP